MEMNGLRAEVRELEFNSRTISRLGRCIHAARADRVSTNWESTDEKWARNCILEQAPAVLFLERDSLRSHCVALQRLGDTHDNHMCQRTPSPVDRLVCCMILTATVRGAVAV
jgi:hypothetical protein